MSSFFYRKLHLEIMLPTPPPPPATVPLGKQGQTLIEKEGKNNFDQSYLSCKFISFLLYEATVVTYMQEMNMFEKYIHVPFEPILTETSPVLCSLPRHRIHCTSIQLISASADTEAQASHTEKSKPRSGSMVLSYSFDSIFFS